MPINFKTAIFNFSNIKENLNTITVIHIPAKTDIEYRDKPVNQGPIKFNMIDLLYKWNLTDTIYFIKPKNINEVENFSATLNYFHLRSYSKGHWHFYKTTVKKFYMILLKQINPEITGVQLANATNIFAKGYTPKTAANLCGVKQYILENILSGKYETYDTIDTKTLARALNFQEEEYTYINNLAEEITNDN